MSTDDLFSFDLDPNVSDDLGGVSPPLVQWVNGDKTRKKTGGFEYTGGFFVSTEQGVEIPGMVPHTLITRDGNEIEGFASRDLKGAIIHTRTGWQSKDTEGGLAMTFPNSMYDEAIGWSYEGRATGRGQILFLIDGMDEPVVLTFRGLVSARALKRGGPGGKVGIVPNVVSTLISAANRENRKKGKEGTFPLCLFGVTLGAERDAKGEPIFEKVGKGTDTSNVTMPQWLDKPIGMVTPEVLNKHYIGKDRAGIAQSLHAESRDWKSAWTADKLAERLQVNAVAKLKFQEAMGAVTRQKAATAGAGVDAAAETGVPSAQEAPF